MMETSSVVWNNNYDRSSHLEFFDNRPWSTIQHFWANILLNNGLPSFLIGDSIFGISNLKDLNEQGSQEFKSNNPKFKRKTFAFTIGYNGMMYSGYQQQKGIEGIITVEDDLEASLEGQKFIAAGRTDKDVSAVSQVISFSTYNDITETQLIEKMKSHPSFQNGKLAVFDCYRVPRKFHPLFCATWRRYIYLFPLNEGTFSSHMVDVDIDFINECFSFIEEKELPFNGFAHRENRQTGTGQSDLCILKRLKASYLNLNDIELNKPFENPDSKHPVIVIELVGNRFLRRMVRLLVATVVRESVLPLDERDNQILLKIALSGSRDHASLAVSGFGLALCGVGYDLSTNINDLNKEKNSNEELKQIQENSNDKLSRRAKYHANKRTHECILDKDNDNPPSKQNIFSIHSYLSSLSLNVINQDSHSLEFLHELLSFDDQLLFFPQRLFSFSFGEIIINQSYSDVGKTIWDAETILSHYLDQNILTILNNNIQTKEAPLLFLELGAGTALASIAISKKLTPEHSRIFIQDIGDVILFAKDSISQNNIEKVEYIDALWGPSLVNSFRNQSDSLTCDFILAADVLYHTEDFDSLLNSIRELLAPEGYFILAFEERRKDVTSLLNQLQEIFQLQTIQKYSIDQKSEIRDSDTQRKTNVFLFVFKNMNVTNEEKKMIK